MGASTRRHDRHNGAALGTRLARIQTAYIARPHRLLPRVRVERSRPPRFTPVFLGHVCGMAPRADPDRGMHNDSRGALGAGKVGRKVATLKQTPKYDNVRPWKFKEPSGWHLTWIRQNDHGVYTGTVAPDEHVQRIIWHHNGRAGQI